ncbi:Dabb family protein [Paramuribaculum intestinale]|uniref:Dabb family protein n=1 Tax=Paramuribaculum intestinale TaxID=2094151 RepID=UPI00272AFFD2|nr:Dabb family protein [Paramuribaculum intestinale]
MVKHIVTFKLSGSTKERAAVALRFAEALKALPGQIECLESIEVGINENPAEDWDVVLTATLPSLADVAVYAAHPAHVAAASIIAGCKAARACVDYTVG